MQQSETKLLEQARNGDAQAFSELVELYQRPVYNMCYRMLGNAQEAEDAAQETFLRAYKAIKRYDPSRKFITWLLSIAANYCIDQHRRRRIIQVDIEAVPMGELGSKSRGNEAKMIEKQASMEMQELLASLAPQDRAAVVMHYWYDYSYKEIATELSLSESAVKSRLHRARKSLALALQRKQEKTIAIDRRQHDQGPGLWYGC